jgi:hypothetical protein
MRHNSVEKYTSYNYRKLSIDISSSSQMSDTHIVLSHRENHIHVYAHCHYLMFDEI